MNKVPEKLQIPLKIIALGLVAMLIVGYWPEISYFGNSALNVLTNSATAETEEIELEEFKTTEKTITFGINDYQVTAIYKTYKSLLQKDLVNLPPNSARNSVEKYIDCLDREIANRNNLNLMGVACPIPNRDHYTIALFEYHRDDFKIKERSSTTDIRKIYRVLTKPNPGASDPEISVSFWTSVEDKVLIGGLTQSALNNYK